MFQLAHHDKRKAVTTTWKGGYTAAVQNIYGVPPLPPEEHHKVIDHVNIIFQGMKMQSHELEVLEKSN